MPRNGQCPVVQKWSVSGCPGMVCSCSSIYLFLVDSIYGENVESKKCLCQENKVLQGTRKYVVRLLEGLLYLSAPIIQELHIQDDSLFL